MYNTNTARKLQPENRPKKAEYPRLRVVKTTQKQKNPAITFKLILACAVLVVAICFSVHNKIKISEINSQINVIESELRVLEAENVRMQSELEPTESLRIVAERAQEELGMHRLDRYQISYVNIYEGDKVDLAIAKPEEGFSGQVEVLAFNIGENLKKMFES